MNTYFSIGEISKLFNLPIKTLRYYDEKGILKPVYTNPSTKYRYYSREQFMSIDLIKYFKLMGMSLNQIKEFIQSDSSVEVMFNSMKKQSEALEKKINELNEVKSYLNDIEDSIEEVLKYEKNKVFIKYNNERTIIRYPCKYSNINELDLSIRNVILHLEEKYNDVYPLIAMESSFDKLKDCGEVVYTHVSDFSKRDNEIYKDYNFSKKENNYGTKHILPAGDYITIFFDDNWSYMKKYHKMILDYIIKNKLVIEGNFNEIWVMPRIDSKGKEITLGCVEVLLKK